MSNNIIKNKNENNSASNYEKVDNEGTNSNNSQIPVTSIAVVPNSCLMHVGEKITLSAMVLPRNATNKTIRWLSTDNTVATVTFSTGEVSARGLGSATISASANDGSGASGACNILVVDETIRGDYSDFLDLLGYYESSNRYNIEKGSYLGRYMMGPLALQEAGFMDAQGNWTATAQSYGIYDKDDFLASINAQEVAIRACHKKVWTYLRTFADAHEGEVYQNVPITESGLLAGSHLVGAAALKSAIMNDEVVTDGNGKPAHEYMNTMAYYDISEIK